VLGHVLHVVPRPVAPCSGWCCTPYLGRLPRARACDVRRTSVDFHTHALQRRRTVMRMRYRHALPTISTCTTGALLGLVMHAAPRSTSACSGLCCTLGPGRLRRSRARVARRTSVDYRVLGQVLHAASQSASPFSGWCCTPHLTRLPRARAGVARGTSLDSRVDRSCRYVSKCNGC
jgi:hypothetical protein